MDNDYDRLQKVYYAVRNYMAAKDRYRERENSTNLDAMSFAEEQLRKLVDF